MGVFLLTPTKKAYLRYYQDLEADLMGPQDSPEQLEMDTESLLRKLPEQVSGGSPSTAGLQVAASLITLVSRIWMKPHTAVDDSCNKAPRVLLQPS